MSATLTLILNVICAVWLVGLTAGWLRLRRVLRDVERLRTARQVQRELDAERARRGRPGAGQQR